MVVVTLLAALCYRKLSNCGVELNLSIIALPTFVDKSSLVLKESGLYFKPRHSLVDVENCMTVALMGLTKKKGAHSVSLLMKSFNFDCWQK